MTTEPSVAKQGKTVEVKRFIGIDKLTGQVESKRYHAFSECGFLSDRGADELNTVNEREIRLLGLKMCVVCEKRETGGPAIEALKDIFANNSFFTTGEEKGHEQLAWTMLNELKSRGFYLAQRGKKAE